ncbi:MAG: DUF1566 domain-containing protein [Nitrospira sp.]|nr:DUF1566 domain-containing protein [Nitrospira sp.]
MNRQRFLTVTISVMVLSAGLVIMTDSAGAATIDKSGNHPIQNSWDENLPSASRFTVLNAFGGAAVRDNNTGLVWEQAPDAGIEDGGTAVGVCLMKAVGGTRGWRLPSVVELTSLLDGSPGAVAPFIPTSVFSGVRVDTGYWSATTWAETPTSAWTVNFSNGTVGPAGKSAASNRAWCVRGGMNADQY